MTQTPIWPVEPTKLAQYIDHTLLKPDATDEQIRQLCAEANHFGFASVCLNPTWVALATDLLAESPVKVCTVIGFPLGATLTTIKAEEARQSVSQGADEVDMVINVGRLKSGQYDLVQEDIAAVVRATGIEAKGRDVVVKVIIETALLTNSEKIKACELAMEADADFVKTSTGFSKGGATIEDVALMRQVVGNKLGVKAAGGIRTLKDAMAMIAAGATRLGASSGVKIMKEALGQDNGSSSAGDKEGSY
jgi:deoxyribose-phosphate aldolase